MGRTVTEQQLPPRISRFRDRYFFLSNFARTPIRMRGVPGVWPTSEHAYQAAKTTSEWHAEWVREAGSPREAQIRGRQVPMRPYWEQVKRRVMLEILLAKFTDPELGGLLRSTRGHLLIEGNTWHDDYWGAVPDARNITGRLWPAEDGSWLAGRNWLGRLLMVTRDVIEEDY